MEITICPRCGRTYPIRENRWRCECGSILELGATSRLDPGKIDGHFQGMWRYAHALPIQDLNHIISMGEGWTPLVPLAPDQTDVLVKLEFVNPTGSYKDRGVSVMVSKLLEEGINDLVEDFSGNAGAALAAYSARAKMHCRIFVPASHSAGKMKQIRAYGAELVAVPGTRKETELAAMQASQTAFYASHAHSPLFVEGCKTIAYEIWEQMDHQAPLRVITPLGQGSILLGLAKGFHELMEAGLIEHEPGLIGVQAEACAPLAKAFAQGSDLPVAIEGDFDTIAEGIKLAEPVRGREVLRAVRETGGAILAAGEAEIAQAKTDLAQYGFYVEPTAAVPLAGYRQLANTAIDGKTVLILTGSGLKSSNRFSY